MTSIGEYAFWECSALTTVDFPVLTNVKDNAFRNCSKLATADFPVATRIGGYAFRDCSVLRTLILRSATMALLNGVSALAGTIIQSGSGHIYVPAALVDSYKAATNWSTFAAQFRSLEDYTVDGTTTGALDASKI